MIHHLRLFALRAGLLLALSATPALASETPSQAALRSHLARFWQVSESEAAAVPASLPATASPLHPLRAPGDGRPTCPAPAPPPRVEARQAVDRDRDNGHFGLRLFGGLELFNFFWGDESVEETDSLSGRR